MLGISNVTYICQMKKALLKTSEIGKASTVNYRARVLKIEPKGKKSGENLYSLEDADKILSYKADISFHCIKHYKTLQIILDNEKFRYNIPYAAKFFNLKESKIQNMINEYVKSGCFITPSKMNNEPE